ncbi:MAG: hypothetical protein IJQ90_05015 [Alphaproteobacteria bacterium]|nr:hypothetical protein [Alphaproteobacteria bacterium]
MAEGREYKYKKNWFKNNLVAIPAGVFGNCSACVFRNAIAYCKNMACTYYDGENDFIESVYWRGVQTNAIVGMWPELRNFFDTTPAPRIREISNDIMTKSVLEKIQKTR